MKIPMLRLLLPVMLGFVVAGCASTDAVKIDRKEAARSHAESAVQYLRQRDFRNAKEKLDIALKYDADNVVANWTMGLLMEQIDRAPEADRYYKIAMRQSPDDPDITNTYAVYLCKSGKIDEALPLFDKLIRNRLYREPYAAATNAAGCLRTDKRNADALTYLDRALLMRGDYVDAVIQKADILVAMGKGAQSRQTVDAYLALNKPKDKDPHRPDLLLVGVRAAQADGDQDAANKYARLLRRDFPSSPQTAALPQLLQATK